VSCRLPQTDHVSLAGAERLEHAQNDRKHNYVKFVVELIALSRGQRHRLEGTGRGRSRSSRAT